MLAARCNARNSHGTSTKLSLDSGSIPYATSAVHCPAAACLNENAGSTFGSSSSPCPGSNISCAGATAAATCTRHRRAACHAPSVSCCGLRFTCGNSASAAPRCAPKASRCSARQSGEKLLHSHVATCRKSTGSCESQSGQPSVCTTLSSPGSPVPACPPLLIRRSGYAHSPLTAPPILPPPGPAPAPPLAPPAAAALCRRAARPPAGRPPSRRAACRVAAPPAVKAPPTGATWRWCPRPCWLRCRRRAQACT
eukprot:70933-Prymnesium_polylepis.1